MLKCLHIWGGDVDALSIEIEKSLVPITGVVFLACNENTYNAISGSKSIFERLVDLVNLKSIPLHILTGGIENNTIQIDLDNLRYKNIQIHYWSTFWFARTFFNVCVNPNYEQNKLIGLDVKNINVAKDLDYFPYAYVSMNNIAKNHRCKMMDTLAEYSLIDRGAIAWRDINRGLDPIRHTIPAGVTDSEYLKYPYQYWKPVRLILDQSIDCKFNQEVLPLQYTQSFMQIVTESMEDEFFLSEKTAMPILFNKPFLVLGSQGFHKVLANMGFQLYDELFDYSFDRESDVALRCKGIAENVSKFANMNPLQLKDIYTGVFDKLVYNNKLARHLAGNIFPEPWLKLYDQYTKTKNVENQELYNITKFVKEHKDAY